MHIVSNSTRHAISCMIIHTKRHTAKLHFTPHTLVCRSEMDCASGTVECQLMLQGMTDPTPKCGRFNTCFNMQLHWYNIVRNLQQVWCMEESREVCNDPRQHFSRVSDNNVHVSKSDWLLWLLRMVADWQWWVGMSVIVWLVTLQFLECWMNVKDRLKMNTEWMCLMLIARHTQRARNSFVRDEYIIFSDFRAKNIRSVLCHCLWWLLVWSCHHLIHLFSCFCLLQLSWSCSLFLRLPPWTTSLKQGRCRRLSMSRYTCTRSPIDS